jgi:hypothetical protein
MNRNRSPLKPEIRIRLNGLVQLSPLTILNLRRQCSVLPPMQCSDPEKRELKLKMSLRLLFNLKLPLNPEQSKRVVLQKSRRKNFANSTHHPR